MNATQPLITCAFCGRRGENPHNPNCSRPAEVSISEVRCPREAEHRSEANVLLRERPDGTLFCPVHGEVEP